MAASRRRLTLVGLALLPVVAGVLEPRLRAQEASTEEETSAETPPVPLWEAPDRCKACHVEADWSRILEPDDALFDHASTGFRLRGEHADAACDECHRRGLRALTRACHACHEDPHGGLRTRSCGECHDERSWQLPRDFAFHERTRFPLTGAHASLHCEACHRQRRGEAAATTPTECLVCHAPQYRAARPDHTEAGFTQCATCHSTSTFRGATYTHQSYTLLGQHAITACVECHDGRGFAGLAGGGTECAECHQDDYDSTTALSQQSGGGVPDHPGEGFPLTCAVAGCHPDAEASGTFDTDGSPGQ